jgi:ligand-binding SRPBCC domain-containing protein
MFILRSEQIINASIEEVFPFFATPENLEKITPANLGFVIKTPRPLEMRKGATFEYTIKLGMLRFPWITLIKEYNPPLMFQDIQRFGPYKKWEHTHEFVSIGEKTKIIDTVDYDLFPKFLSKQINDLIIRQKIEDIFTFRKNILEKIFNKTTISKNSEIFN